MTSMYPVRIYQDRYGGSYSGGEWVAVDMKTKTMEIGAIEEGVLGSDTEVREFWVSVKDAKWIAVGRTPNEALEELEGKRVLPPTRRSSGITLISPSPRKQD